MKKKTRRNRITKRASKVTALTGQKSRIEAPEVPQQTKNASQPPRWWMAAKWTIGTLVAGVVAAAAIYQAWGPFWPTEPIVEADELDAALPLRAPFIVENRSFVFPLRITSLGCQIIRMEPITVGDIDVMAGTNVSNYVISRAAKRPMECKIELGNRSDITRVEIRITLRYRRWLRSDALTLVPVSWTPNHWTVGDPIR